MASVATAPTPTTAEPEVTTKKQKPEGAKTPWWMWVAVAATVLFCLFPFYWLINISLKTGNDLQSSSLIPPHPTLSNYKAIFQNPDFTKALRNSAVVAFVTTALALIVGSFCAYALARLRLRGKFVILAIVLTFALPLAIYILVSFFKEIPKDLEEAALVDGATYFQAFRKVVVPLAAPGLATAAILVFIGAWNEFLFAITLTSTPQARTVPAAIAFFTGATTFEIPIGTITAASVVISIPLIVMVLLF